MSIPMLGNPISTFAPSDLARESASRLADKLNPNSAFSLTDSQPQSSEPDLKPEFALNSVAAPKPANEDLRKAFQDFVGQTFFSQMISSMRATTQGAAYFNGGQAEKIFQGQLDQKLSEHLSEASASSISDPMFKLFQLRRGA